MGRRFGLNRGRVSRRANNSASLALPGSNMPLRYSIFSTCRIIPNGFDTSKMRLPPELWFDATDGLKTVRGLPEYVTAKLNDFKQPNPILRDLKAAEALLTAAESASVKFHFTKTEL